MGRVFQMRLQVNQELNIAASIITITDKPTLHYSTELKILLIQLEPIIETLFTYRASLNLVCLNVTQGYTTFTDA